MVRRPLLPEPADRSRHPSTSLHPAHAGPPWPTSRASPRQRPACGQQTSTCGQGDAPSTGESAQALSRARPRRPAPSAGAPGTRRPGGAHRPASRCSAGCVARRRGRRCPRTSLLSSDVPSSDSVAATDTPCALPDVPGRLSAGPGLDAGGVPGLGPLARGHQVDVGVLRRLALDAGCPGRRRHGAARGDAWPAAHRCRSRRPAGGFGDCAPALDRLPCVGADSWSSAGIGSRRRLVGAGRRVVGDAGGGAGCLVVRRRARPARSCSRLAAPAADRPRSAHADAYPPAPRGRARQSSALASSSTLTSLKVTTRTCLTKRAGRYMSHTQASCSVSSKKTSPSAELRTSSR